MKINGNIVDLIQKPESILGYNMYMKAVDLANQYLICNTITRKIIKWTKKPFMLC